MKIFVGGGEAKIVLGICQQGLVIPCYGQWLRGLGRFEYSNFLFAENSVAKSGILSRDLGIFLSWDFIGIFISKT